MSTDSEEKVAQAKAQAPFDDAQADLIMMSNDEVPVHFYVSKFILSVASPIFTDMINIPSPEPKPDEKFQVVALTEDSEALDLSLRHIYPIRPPKVAELRQIRILAEFARKYQVDTLEHHVVHYLTDAVDHDPVGVYAIAITYGYKSVCTMAAKLSLKLPFSRLQSSYVQYAPAELYGELLMYHAACGEAASAVTSERNWFHSLDQTDGFIIVKSEPLNVEGCSSCYTRDFIRPPDEPPNSNPRVTRTKRTERYGPRCLWNYLHRSTAVLARHPDVDAVTTEEYILRGSDCPSCKPAVIRRDMLGFSKTFGGEINRAIGLVPLPKALGVDGIE